MNRFGLAPTALLLASTLTTFGLAACSDDAGGSPTPTPTTTATTSPPAVPTKTCDSAGLVRCDERGRAETCTADAAGNLAWGPKARCANANQVCKGSACVDAPAEAVAQLADMSRVTDFLLDYHPWREPVDEAKVREDATLRLLMGDGSGETFFQVAQGAFRAVPGGHSGIYSLHTPNNATACGGTKDDKIAVPGISWHGVCTAVSGQDIVVTLRKAAANVDLQPGDRIIGVTNGSISYAGATMLDKLGDIPICQPTQPFADSQRDITGASILSIAKPGWVLRVKSAAGAERDVTLPPRLDAYTSCGDGFNRSPGVDRFSVTERPDGYLVVWLKTFAGTTAYPFPPQLTLAAYKQWIQGWVSDLNVELAKYPNAKGIVWDIRGNTGGSQDLATALAMGSKAPALRGGLMKCLARKAKTHPAEFEPVTTAPNAGNDKILPTPELDGMNTVFSYPGKQIVVANGNIYSAADVFVLAAKTAGLQVVGRRGAAAFGASAGAPRKVLASFIVKDIPIYAYVSGWSCVDNAGNGIEGKPPVVDVPVELSSADLAAGLDSQIEEAVKRLSP